MADLAKNLDKAVEGFKTEVQSGQRGNVDIIDPKGQSLQQTGGRNWGGSFGWWDVAAGVALLTVFRKRRAP